jgi:hypothetical protein
MTIHKRRLRETAGDFFQPVEHMTSTAARLRDLHPTD